MRTVVDIPATGRNIKARVKSMKLKRTAVAEELGISEQAVYKWFRGEALPDIPHLFTLSRLLGCTVDDLISTQEIDG